MPPRKKQGREKVGKKSIADIKTRGTKRKNTATTNCQPVKKEKTDASSFAEKKEELKKVKFTGIVPVDGESLKYLKGYRVHIDQGVANYGEYNGIYHAVLNYTDIDTNSNKYYLMQILKSDTEHEYVTWCRWGRVGKTGGTSLKRHGGNEEAAKREFRKVYESKTKNCWFFGSKFRKNKKGFQLIKIDYGEDNDEDKKKVKEIKSKWKEERKQVESRLDKRVQKVIDMIFAVRECDTCMKELEFDIKKAPLGKISADQIKAGYESLEKIERCFQKKGKIEDELKDACNEFYTRIPHDFGKNVPPLIQTHEELNKERQLLEYINNIQYSIHMKEEDAENPNDENIRDLLYQSLRCKLEPLEEDNDEYKMVWKYMGGNCRPHLDVDIFKVEREGDIERFSKSIGNRWLLWHASILTNWSGILKHGLRIAPPEAELISNPPFGKGVYFSDYMTGCLVRCWTNKTHPIGLLVLCEVALGNMIEKPKNDKNASNLSKGKHSIKGLGYNEPNPNGNFVMDCGTIVPLGQIGAAKNRCKTERPYNEYVVYNEAQIKARYLVKERLYFPNIPSDSSGNVEEEIL